MSKNEQSSRKASSSARFLDRFGTKTTKLTGLKIRELPSFSPPGIGLVSCCLELITSVNAGHLFAPHAEGTR